MLLKRQRLLLALLDSLGGGMGNLDFQKLLLLYCIDVEDVPSYHFVPYQYGGFSFTSYADRRKLVRAGLLCADDNVWKLTGRGKAEASRHPGLQARVELAQFRDWMHLRGNRLVAETYRRFPYFATRSKMVSQLGLTAEERDCIEAARPPRKSAGLLTIGYEGRSLEEFANVLLNSSVTVLCDVRRNPLSRKYGFSKGTLSQACDGIGIGYEHVPELGISSERRKTLQTRSDYAVLFNAYRGDTLPYCLGSVKRIRDWIGRGERVALTCYERDAAMCHRHCVAGEVLKLDGGVGAIEHL